MKGMASLNVLSKIFQIYPICLQLVHHQSFAEAGYRKKKVIIKEINNNKIKESNKLAPNSKRLRHVF